MKYIWGATAVLEIDTDKSADAQAQFERVQEQLKEGLQKDGKTLYKGAAMYGAKVAEDSVKGNASSSYVRMGGYILFQNSKLKVFNGLLIFALSFTE